VECRIHARRERRDSLLDSGSIPLNGENGRNYKNL